ncbi:MAG: diacylglycerol kinase family protein [Bacteroidota bacterium]
MRKQGNHTTPTKFITSFKYAFSGIAKVFTSEFNFRFHSVAAIAVIIAGFVLDITRTEWLFIAFAIGIVLVAEAINSAIEKLVDLVSPQQQPLAGWVKDVAAGAVLIAAITAAVIGALVFVPYII